MQGPRVKKRKAARKKTRARTMAVKERMTQSRTLARIRTRRMLPTLNLGARPGPLSVSSYLLMLLGHCLMSIR